MRQWAEEHPGKEGPLQQLLKKEFTLKRPIEWTTTEEQGRDKIARFLPNPEPNWGPKSRAKGAAPSGAGDGDGGSGDAPLGAAAATAVIVAPLGDSAPTTNGCTGTAGSEAGGESD